MPDGVMDLSPAGFAPAVDAPATSPSWPQLVSRIPPIPKLKSRHGPLTARRLRGFYALLAAVFVVGMLPSLLGMSSQWKAFGLGLVLPGGGFLYAGGLASAVFALGALVCFATITFIWWARGVVLGPAAVQVGTALLSAVWIGHRPGVPAMEVVVPAAVALFYFGVAARKAQDFRAGQKRAEAFNPTLARAEPILRDYPVEAAGEMPPTQITEFRRMMDLALQPVESWDGFAMNDTWQDGALRYQICTMSWNLALGQYTQLPAFHGHLNQAQEHLIKKHIHRNTWNYWYWESLWGNLRIDKNPVHIDNIMLSGFLGVSLGMFETASGSSAFDAPGALTFRWDDKTAFPYSHRTMMDEVVKNYKRYDYGWFPCEPKWIYSMCNLVGRTALALHDGRHGTHMVDEIAERFDQTMREEMALPDGRIKVCTSSLFGFQVPSLSGLFGETWGLRFMTHYAPAEAERLWQVMKNEYISRRPDGGLDFKLLPLGWDTRKPADFSKWPDINPLIVTLWAALEMGDEEIVEATSRTIDEGYGEGMAASMTWSGRNTIRNMVVKGLPKAWAEGPVLDRAAYPEVIVARAVTDGSALSLVLHPGEQPVQTSLGVKRLKPGRRYRVVQTGEAVTADAEGRADLSVQLAGRTEVDLVPMV